MATSNSNPTLTNCTFRENSAHDGAGIYNSMSGGSPRLTDCTFVANQVQRDGGGIKSSQGSPTLTDCMFIANSAGHGGGMWNGFRNNSTLTNCMFIGNWAERGRGIDNSESSPTLINSVLWGNTDNGGADESAQIYGGTPVINYSCIQGWLGGLGGNGNHGGNPLFVDSDGADDTPGTEDDNLRLTPGSSCVDVGYDGAVPLDVTTDLDGNPRFVDGDGDNKATVDMGAYEYQGTCQTDADCDDHDPCTEDTCDPQEALCANVAIECSPGETCVNGECVNLCVNVDCDDQYACTEDSCDPNTGECVNTPTECPSAEICMGGVCVSGACEFTDADSDGDIDLADYAVYQNCFTGPR